MDVNVSGEWAEWLRRPDSNRRPSGYEPDELPLLHAAETEYRTQTANLNSGEPQWGVGDGDPTVNWNGVGDGFADADGDGEGVGVGSGEKLGRGAFTPPDAGPPVPGGVITNTFSPGKT